MPPRLRPRPAARRAAEAQRAALYERNRQIVAGGVCPDCGTKLKRNSSIPGWWQCQASINPPFRDAELRDRDLPRCNFQCFTQ